MSEEPAEWTIDRLARLAAAALAAGALTPQPNGRIREVPDVRTIRYYTSIGLLDRPGAMRARTALYGRRHLAQLVAIKRLQASGLTLTEVQQRLLGADVAAVERIAMLPEDVSALEAEVAADAQSANGVAAAPAVRERFWSVRPAPAAPALSAPAPAPSAAEGADIAPSASRAPAAPAVPLAPAAQTAQTAQTAPALVSGVRLAADVTLLLSANPGRLPDAADRAAIAEAARPLLDLLHRLGLSEA